MSAPRATKDGAWAWFAKDAHRCIRDNIENSQRAWLTYTGLCKLASDRGTETFRVTTRAIADASMQGVRTVERSLPDLEACGLILRKKSFLPNGGKDVTTYTLTATGAHGPVKMTHGVTANESELADASNCIKEKKEKEEPETSSEFSFNPTKQPDSAAPAAAVLAIYEAYPRKAAKPTALAAIEAALETVEADWLRARVTAYAKAVASWPPEDRKFIPYPAKWFNDERYHDDPAEWRRDSSEASSSDFDLYATRPL